MAQPAGTPRRISYAQLQLFSLLALAIVPLIVFSVIVGTRLFFLVSTNADQATGQALKAAHSVFEAHQQQLSDLTRSYATWDAFRTGVATMDRNWIESEVVDFVVAQGSADAALLKAGQAEVGSGDPALVAAMLAEVDRLGTGQPVATVFARPEGVFELAIWPVELPANAVLSPGVLAFARRLDESFVSQATAMTGWDVAVAGSDGRINVASRLEPFSKLGLSAGGTGGSPAALSHWSRQANGFMGGSEPLLDSDGRLVGALMVASDLGALGDISEQLLLLFGVILIPTVLTALLLSVFLSFRIRARLQTVERGIEAVAAGDLSVRLPTEGRDGFERLASSHNQLAAALERRDRALSQLLEAISGINPYEGVARVGRDGAAAATTIFGLGWCELRSGDGAVVASTFDATSAVAVRADQAGELEIGRGEQDWRLAWGGLPEGWSAADENLLEVYAGQLGSALRDAVAYERAASRTRSLRRGYRLQADFLRGVSHNLQSPLSTIVGLSDDLRSEPGLKPGSARRAEVIHGEAERLNRLVRQLLTMSRLEAGTLEVEAEPCAVEPIIKRAWRALHSDRPFELHSEAGGALALADRQSLEQILWILLDNAVRYAPSGPIRVRVSLDHRGQHAADKQPEMLIRVQDEGPGVPEAERKAIFRRFQRGSTSTGREGTGLGLDVARGLLRAMNGRIFYEAGPIGATFAIALPAELADAPD
jgi:signal transduction histidine kinase/HAMP domain-containing protein